MTSPDYIGHSGFNNNRRPRRLRHNKNLRRMLQDVQLQKSDLICPIFVTHGKSVHSEIASMPGQFQLSLDQLATEVNEIVGLGISSVILFGIPECKDEQGSDAFADNGIIQQAIRAVKKVAPDLIVIADTCLCEYTSHGHCGLLEKGNSNLPEGYVLNDPTLKLLEKVAVSQAAAGADIVAPSGMMDGMVGAIRRSLDANAFSETAIMSYSVKYASAYYGPFRDAADGAPEFGDRKTHQMDFAESKQAFAECELDIQQGADFLMVKPALAYLDVIAKMTQQFPHMPMVAYNVSGEYAMVKAAAANGWLDEKPIAIENLTAMKRAGADLLITYHAKDLCRWLEQ